MIDFNSGPISQPMHGSPHPRGLKEPITNANGGGIGVSYSSINLAGGYNARTPSKGNY